MLRLKLIFFDKKEPLLQEAAMFLSMLNKRVPMLHNEGIHIQVPFHYARMP